MAIFKIQKKPFTNTPDKKRSKSTIGAGFGRELPAIVNTYDKIGQYKIDHLKTM